MMMRILSKSIQKAAIQPLVPSGHHRGIVLLRIFLKLAEEVLSIAYCFMQPLEIIYRSAIFKLRRHLRGVKI